MITFDLDDTLWDNEPVIKHAIQASVSFLSQQLSIEAIANHTLETAKQQVLEKNPTLAFDLTTLRSAYYTQALINSGVDVATAKQVGEEATELFMTLRSQVKPFNEADNVLAQLAKTYRLGAITNGNCRFETIAISQHFDFYVSPLEAQAAKPDPAIYQFSAKRYGYSASETLHVGDCTTNDVLGAKNAGCHTAWLNLHAQKSTPTHADWIIHALEDLLVLNTNKV